MKLCFMVVIPLFHTSARYDGFAWAFATPGRNGRDSFTSRSKKNTHFESIYRFSQ